MSQRDTWDSYAPFFLHRWSHQKILGERDLLSCHFDPMKYIDGVNSRVCQQILGEIAKSGRVRIFCPRDEQCQILKTLVAELESLKIQVVPTIDEVPSCTNAEGLFLKASHSTFARAYDTSDGQTEKCDYYWISSGEITLCLAWGEASQSHRADLALVTTGDKFELRLDLPPAPSLIGSAAQGAISGDCHPDFPKTLDTQMAQWLAKEFARLLRSPTAISLVCDRLDPDCCDPI